jgi:hypothetical protein
MRRISIIIVILSITVSANAAVQIGVDGVLSPPEVDVQIGGTANISIWTDTTIPVGSYLFGILGVPIGEPGSISWDDIRPIEPCVFIEPGPEPPIPGFSSWIEFQISPITSPVPGGSLLLDGIQFNCKGLGNVNLQLLGSEDYSVWTYFDTQVIHQIPEPATIALLGFGAMLLKRRR